VSTPPIRRTPEALAPVTGSERWSGDGFLDLVATAEAPREIRRFLDRVADASPVILYVFDLALNRVVYCNDAVEPILGYAPDDIQGMGATLVLTLVHPDDRPTLPTRVARLAAAAETVLDGFLRTTPRGDDLLTSREREIVQLLAEGKSNKAIAEALAMSVKMVDGHRTSVMRKLGARSLADVVRYAIRNGLAEP